MIMMRTQLSTVKNIFKSNYWERRSFLGLIVAFIASITMTTVFIVDDYRSRLGLAILVGVIIIYALPARFRVGQCPNCGAQPKSQLRTIGNITTKPFSQTITTNGDVSVSQGWNVEFAYQVNCDKCKILRNETKTHFISKDLASSQAQALLIARDAEGIKND